MRMFTVNEVADTLITLAREKNTPISNLKLQKLMYYAQAWSLVANSKPLFSDEFEAWVHGPVVPCLFRRFRENKWETIATSDVNPVDDLELRDFLSNILKVYGPYAASQLEMLTHEEAPWREARNGLLPDVPSHAIISRQSMKIFYTQKRHEAGKA